MIRLDETFGFSDLAGMRGVLLLFILLGPMSVRAEQDSLLNVLNGLPNDTSRLPVLTDLLRATVFSKPDDALNYARRYQEIARRAGNGFELGKGHNYGGMAYVTKGERDKAMEQFLLALEYFRDGPDPWYTAMAYNNIGTILDQEKRDDKALEAFGDALQLFRQDGDSIWVANVNNNIAGVLTRQLKYDSALHHYAQAERLLIDAQQQAYAASVRMNMGHIRIKQGRPQEAVGSLRQAVMSYPEDEDESVRSFIHSLLGLALSRTGGLDSALFHLRSGLSIAEAAGARTERMYALEHLAEHFARTGSYKEAYERQQMAVALRDSILNEQRSAQIAEMQEKYESGLKDAQLAENEAQLKQRAVVIRAVAGGALLLLVAALFAYRAYRLKKRTSEQLAAKNAIIDAQLKEKELLVREIHHRVKNNLQVVSSLLDLQSRRITDQQAQDAMTSSRHRVHSMALIHQDLYRDDDLMGIAMPGYVDKLVGSLSAGLKLDDDRIRVVADVEPLSLDVDTAIPIGLILNELITNAFKYAFPDGRSGEVRITVRREGGKLLLEVRDNGVGYDPHAQRGAESTNFGMEMIRSFARKLRAEWSITNDGGTVARLLIERYKVSSDGSSEVVGGGG